ncbi:MAG: DUF2177 family protein [Planctomycetes bacterium]|nr:DUF2177 family protein [Planctomycetota bacterium]
MKSLNLLLLLLPVFLLLDITWLGVVMADFYSRELGDLVRRQGGAMAPRWAAAVPVYLLIPGGLVLFVRPRFASSRGLMTAWGWGAVFGGVLYGVYDLTNLSILEKWTLPMTVADILWGCVLCGTSSALLYLLDRRLK